MCGIAGILDVAGGRIDPGALLAMTAEIAHRGPDDEGYVLIDPSAGRAVSFSGQASNAVARARLMPLTRATAIEGASMGLGHRRFSIVDLSDAGHQPLFDSERRCCVVFNGELYNHAELRDELAASGARFVTRCDTEVLVEGYKRWGTDCFERFNGFWAIALYDFARRRLILSRDRVGKKPLFWAWVGSRLFFASEIKALLRVPEIHASRRMHEPSVLRWLAYGQKDVGVETCFEGIRALPAASWLAIDGACRPDEDLTGRCRSFWRVPEQRVSENDVSADEAARTVRSLLRDAVRLRLQADVPVAVELSGGLDSSTLVALASEQAPGAVTTYTVRFPDPEANEEPFARSVASRFGVDYRVLDPPIDRFWSDVGAFTWLEEEPYHAPNLQTNQDIWAQMREAGTKVSLNGAAGDELFAGYPRHYPVAQLENLLAGRVGAFVRNGRYHTEARGAARPWLTPVRSAIEGALQRLAPSLLAARAESAAPHLRARPPAPLDGGHTLSSVLRRDMTSSLMPYWLVSGDRGFMGVPLEVRAPFLDYRLIEYVFQLPITYLIRDGWHKWVLRRAMADLLPEDVLWRRRKLGFPFPFQRFYRRSAPVLDHLFAASRNPLVDVRQRAAVGTDWRTISFLLWYEWFFAENRTLFDELQRMAPSDAGCAPGFRPRYLARAAP